MNNEKVYFDESNEKIFYPGSDMGIRGYRIKYYDRNGTAKYRIKKLTNNCPLCGSSLYIACCHSSSVDVAQELSEFVCIVTGDIHPDNTCPIFCEFRCSKFGKIGLRNYLYGCPVEMEYSNFSSLLGGFKI